MNFREAHSRAAPTDARNRQTGNGGIPLPEPVTSAIKSVFSTFYVATTGGSPLKTLVRPGRHGEDLESVIATADLSRRLSRSRDCEAENIALVALAQQIAASPEDILQKLVETTLELCKADSAGISILEDEGGQKIFRWHAIAGRYAPHRWGATPRHFSPCGTVLDRNALMLFSRPGRYFTYLDETIPPIVEALLFPLAVGGELVGTIWLMANDERRKFDTEDARVLENLAKFAAAAYQLSLASKAIRESDRRKDDFLAVLAHELRNPLAPMQNAVHYLRHRGLAQPDERKAIDVLGRQIQSMTRMIDDLLDISRISRDRLELRKERIELGTVINHALETSRPFLDLCGHALTVALPTVPIWLEGDFTRLAQVIANLLNNAAKYTRDGGRIAVSVAELENEITIRVRDDGLGIATEMLTRIFEPFSQVDSSLERSRGGLGIGLALVKRLVQMHGGTVEAISAGLGRGSEFVVRIPSSVQSGAAPEIRLADPVESFPGASRELRILVVDDNRDSANSLAMLLRLQGYEALTAYDGPSALQVVADTRPQVVLQDLGMPGMSGYEVARQLSREPSTQATVLFALSGYGTSEDKQRSREAGFREHLVKPVDLEVLQGLLKSVQPHA
jgi:signal transduction histidine kinase/CheY-like chemotaxis protein